MSRNLATTTKGIDLPQIDRRNESEDIVTRLHTSNLIKVLALSNVDRCSARHCGKGKFFTRGGSESESGVQRRLGRTIPTRSMLLVRNLR